MSLADRLCKALYFILRLLRAPLRLLRKLTTCYGQLLSRLRHALPALRPSPSRHESSDINGNDHHDSNLDYVLDNDEPTSGSGLGTSQRAITLPIAFHDTLVPVSASVVPTSALVAGSDSSIHSPARRGSSSYPNLRQTLAPLTTTTLAPRPHSINLPSPAHDHDHEQPPGYLSSPIYLETPSSHAPSHLSQRTSVADLGADHLAQARAEFIERDARTEGRIRHSRAPARSNAARSRSSSRQPNSRPSSQARPQSQLSQYPPSITGGTVHNAPGTNRDSRISVASSIERQRPHTPVRMTRAYGSGSSSDSSDSGSSAPGIRLEPPSPEQERRSHNRTFSDMMEVTIQSPSTSSFPRSGYSSPSSSSPSSPRVPRELMNDSPVPISSTRSSELRTVFDSPPVQTVVLPTLPEGRTISEVTPLETPRYNRQKYVPNDPTTFTIPPLCFTFPHSTDGEDPDLRGWEPRTHSEGALYFYHPEKRAFTEAYLYEEVYLDEVEALLAYLQQTLQCMPGIQLPPDYELVAQVAFEDEDGVKAIRWQYYFVDHRTRCLFWLFPLDADIYLTEICGPLSPAHFKHLLESWYWDHVGTFPDNFQTHDDLVDELVGHLTFFSVDVMTSHTSTVPYELSDLTRLIKFMGRKGPGTGAAPRSAALGRMMSIICHWRYIYFHGQRFARLDRFESIHGPAIRPRSWLMSLSSIVFLFAPEAHLLDIEKFYVDNSVARHVWKRHITKLQDEWIEFVLYATVMLTANVSMLSVPDVILFPDNDNAPGAGNNVQSYLAPLRSPAAIASYVSIVCSVGTIVVGLLLIRTHRTKNHDDVNEAVAFMNRLETRLFHYEPLAILYSLPYALLMWAMLSFLISILIFTFRNTDIVTQITVAASSVAVSCLIAWCIVTFWEPSESTLYLRTLRNTFKQRLIRPWASLSEDGASSTALFKRPRRWLHEHSRTIAEKIRKVPHSLNAV